jgi:antitoxin component of MazEF toxin-antitoxin module
MTKKVSKIFASGHSAACLVIPKKVAVQHGLIDDAHVIVESTEQGILIRKVDLEKLEI